jgi:Rad3-related DNA helicase
MRKRKEVEEVLHEPLWNQPIPTMIKKLTDAEKAQMHDQLWRTIEQYQGRLVEQVQLVAQLSEELAAMTKTLDKAGDMLELMTKTATENREAYEAETLSTLEMAKHITQLEGDRDRMIARMNRLANAASVLWEEHKAFGEDMHDTIGVDYMGTDSEGHRMMQELVDEMLIIDCPECKGTGEPEPTGSCAALPPCAKCHGTGLISCLNREL